MKIDIHTKRFEYPIENNYTEDIIERLNLNETDAKFTKDIIMDLEKFAAKCIIENRAVHFPSLGNIRKNQFNKYIKENKAAIKKLRDSSTPIEFKNEMRLIYKSVRDKVKKDEEKIKHRQTNND